MANVLIGGAHCCNKPLLANAPPPLPSGPAANYTPHPSKCKGFVRVARKQSCSTACRASSSSSSAAPAPAPTPSSSEQQSSVVPGAITCQDGYTVFRDEAKGIICYRSPTGEITCEGIDEGPHFQPPPEFFRLKEAQFLATKSQNDEHYVNGAGI